MYLHTRKRIRNIGREKALEECIASAGEGTHFSSVITDCLATYHKEDSEQ